MLYGRGIEPALVQKARASPDVSNSPPSGAAMTAGLGPIATRTGPTVETSAMPEPPGASNECAGSR